ncbi:MAG: type VI secretion system protein TssL, long form [Neisseriaceae bacterium]|nr:type VI secretion system protein TssL, long form [Neisseriaceae bacterium]
MQETISKQAMGQEALMEGSAARPALANPLLTAAKPILILVNSMKHTQSALSSTVLLHKFSETIKDFEEQAERQGAPYETVKAARYCLCTLVDEFAARAGWADENWASHSLLVTFHDETWGGEQFFELLAKLRQDPKKHLDLIELMYYCLSFGYMGKYQVLNDGEIQVERLKRELYQLITQYKPLKPFALVDRQQAMTQAAAKNKLSIPWWVCGVFILLFFAVLYALLSWRLASQFDTVSTQISSLSLPEFAQDTPVAGKTVYLTPFLRNEIDRNLVQVKDEMGRSTITIMGDGLFESGSADVRDQYFPVLARVSQALNSVEGQVVVAGYTDDRPINSLTYPSNWHLSQARADAVRTILMKYINEGSRIRSEGRGASNPIVENSSAENLARNRRVEITLLVTGLVDKPGAQDISHQGSGQINPAEPNSEE